MKSHFLKENNAVLSSRWQFQRGTDSLLLSSCLCLGPGKVLGEQSYMDGTQGGKILLVELIHYFLLYF